MDRCRTLDLNRQVHSELEKKFTKHNLPPLLSICDQVEDFLQQYLRRFVIHEMKLIAEETGKNFSAQSLKRFLYDDVIYEIKTIEYAMNNNILQIVLHNISPARSSFFRRPLKTKIDSLGRYTELHIVTDKAILAFQASIAEVAKIVFESGYRWLAEYVRGALDSLQDKVADNLYSHLRKSLSEQEVENIFLYAIVDRNGLYVVDNLARRVILHRASLRNLSDAMSPVEIAANFSTTSIEIEKLVSRKAIAENVTIEGDFLKSAYNESGHQLTQMVVYQSQRFATQPIVREGRTFMIAAYPVELRSRLEPVLRNERDNLKRILDQGASTLRNTVLQLKNQGTLPKLTFQETLTSWGDKLEYLELKPNLMGLGINLNKMIRDLRERYNRKKSF